MAQSNHNRRIMKAIQATPLKGLECEPHVHALERLHAITVDASLGLEEKIRQLLDLGREVFGLSLAIVSHIEGEDYTVEHVIGPDGTPEPGTHFELGQTYCVHTLAADGPTGFHHAGQSEIRSHPCYQGFGLEAYLGIPLMVDGHRYGTLNFSDLAARSHPFDDNDYSLLRLFALWIGAEIARERHQVALEHQRLLFKSIFQHAPDAVVLTNTERRVVMVNPAFTELFGYTSEEAVGQKTATFYDSPEDFDHQGELRYHDEAEPASAPYQVNYRRKDGGIFTGETVGSVVRDNKGRVLGFLGHIRDITERRRIEQMKDEFISTVSHELRTPLTSIRGVLGLLSGGALGDLPVQVRELLELADKNSQRLLHLINDLLDMEKITTGHMEFVVQRHELMPLITQSLKANEHYARQFSVNFVLAESAPGCHVDVDEERFGQVMSNLLSNAIKYSPAGSEVTVRAERLGDHVRISVEDQGPGVPEAFHDKIFHKFCQADGSTSRSKGGTGLGLSISKAIMQRLHGEIGFDSKPGTGAKFWIELPLSAQPTVSRRSTRQIP